MASTQLSPGVVVLERDLTSVANATVDNVAAIVGSFEKGPVEAMTTVTSERELLAIFDNFLCVYGIWDFCPLGH